MTDETNVSVSDDSGTQIAPEETLVKQSIVNKLVAGTKKEHFDKGYQAALSTLKAAETPAKSVEIDPEIIERKVSEVISKREAENAKLAEENAIQAQFERVKASLAPKIIDAKSRYSDFDYVVEEAELSKDPRLLVVVNEADNAGDVAYELAKSPAKAGTLSALIATGKVNAAVKYVKELSESIKTKGKGSHKVAPQPLSSLKPSAVVADDGARMTVADAKRTYKF